MDEVSVKTTGRKLHKGTKYTKWMYNSVNVSFG